MRSPRIAVASLATLTLALAGFGGTAATAADRSDAPAPSKSRATVSYPLPIGFQPEGIDIGKRDTAYVGSLRDGSIFGIDLRRGGGEIISPAVGVPAVGVEVDQRDRLFVAGGPSGTARVVDTESGAVLAQYQLAAAGAPSFINDVVVTREAAWFTDSVNPVLYRVPLSRSGQLPDAAAVTAVPLTGELAYDSDPATFEVNGIETTPDGAALLVVQSRTGLLFRVTPDGATTLVDLGGANLLNGDGLTRDGRTLYAVQNQLNQVAVVKLAKDGRSGQLERLITDPLFDVPTTVAVDGKRLYLPNARFGTPSPATATYSVTGVSLR